MGTTDKAKLVHTIKLQMVNLMSTFDRKYASYLTELSIMIQEINSIDLQLNLNFTDMMGSIALTVKQLRNYDGLMSVLINIKYLPGFHEGAFAKIISALRRAITVLKKKVVEIEGRIVGLENFPNLEFQFALNDLFRMNRNITRIIGDYDPDFKIQMADKAVPAYPNRLDRKLKPFVNPPSTAVGLSPPSSIGGLGSLLGEELRAPPS